MTSPRQPVRVVVAGALGRMGRLIVDAALGDAQHALVGAVVRAGRGEVGKDAALFAGRAACGVLLDEDLDQALAHAAAADVRAPIGRVVVVDFTTAGQTAAHARLCAVRGAAYVVGTTGLSAADQAALDDAAKTVPVLVASNTSVGANLLMQLAGDAARALPGADVEVVELHHRRKKDSPSGTALSVLDSIAAARGVVAKDVAVTARAGEALRKAGEVGVFGVRGGDVVGEHTVFFFLDGERIELTHRVSDRRIFATGALYAARGVAASQPGRYTMKDVLS